MVRLPFVLLSAPLAPFVTAVVAAAAAQLRKCLLYANTDVELPLAAAFVTTYSRQQVDLRREKGEPLKSAITAAV